MKDNASIPIGISQIKLKVPTLVSSLGQEKADAAAGDAEEAGEPAHLPVNSGGFAVAPANVALGATIQEANRIVSDNRYYNN